jgi:hypothetical protein
MPPQIAPYHLRLDWLMWFAAMSNYYEHPWFISFANKLLRADSATLSLLSRDPFHGERPEYVRAQLYEFHFTTPEERRRTHAWWTRRYAGTYLPPVSLQSPDLQRMVRAITGAEQ